jgi:hypothetical protein
MNLPDGGGVLPLEGIYKNPCAWLENDPSQLILYLSFRTCKL